MVDVVVGQTFGARAGREAATVRGDRAISGPSERGHQPVPAMRGLRESMAEEDPVARRRPRRTSVEDEVAEAQGDLLDFDHAGDSSVFPVGLFRRASGLRVVG